MVYDLAILVGPRGFRHLGELNQFLDLPHFRTVFLTADGYRPFEGPIDYLPVRVRKLLPDLLAKLFVRKPYGPVSFVDFSGLDGLPDCDIINAVELYSFVSQHSTLLAKRKGARLCVSSWETISSNPLFFFPPYVFNMARVLRRAELFLVPTHIAAECLLDIGVSADRVRVTYPGIDLNEFVPRKDPHDGFRILFVGRLDPEKGIDKLLKSFVMLYSTNKEAELWLCGPYRTGHQIVFEASRLAKKYPIRLLGELPRNEIPSAYARCDVLCLPSVDRRKWGVKVWEEQFGWSLVEAMASGLPIVASECGAIREVVGGHNVIVNQGSISELFDALSTLARDRELRATIGEMNRRRAEEYYDLRRQRLELDRALVELIER